MPPAEDGDRQPVTRAEADQAYRRLRAALLLTLGLMLVIALAMALLGIDGWEIYLGLVVVVEGLGLPLFLRYYRRELDRRVRASEAALGGQ